MAGTVQRWTGEVQVAYSQLVVVPVCGSVWSVVPAGAASTRPGREPATARVPTAEPQRQSVYVLQKWLSTSEAAAGDGAEGEAGAAVAGAAEAAVPAPAAAASAAVSTVLREVGLVMGETPGRERIGAADAGRCANYRGSRPDPASDSARAVGPILVWSTDVTSGCPGPPPGSRRVGA
ncbi:hypothetical protein GCM10010518_60210 [Kitasatospora cinereorecta]